MYRCFVVQVTARGAPDIDVSISSSIYFQAPILRTVTSLRFPRSAGIA